MARERRPAAQVGSPARFRSRLLLFELDSVRQAERIGPCLGPNATYALADAIRDLTGMVRTGLMVADRLLVTDSMILDGAFFLLVPPDRLAGSLGCSVHELPITVLSSRSTLADALKAKQSTSGFKWQLADLFDDPDRLRRHWRQWTSSSLPLELEPYGRHGQAGVSGGFITERPGVGWSEALGKIAADCLKRVIAEPTRSGVEALCTAAKRDAPAAAAQIEQVRRWWESAYLMRIAESNEADWLRFTGGSGSLMGDGGPALSGDRRSLIRGAAHVTGSGRRRIRLGGALRETLSRVPPALYAIMRYHTAAESAALRRNPSVRRLNDLTYALTHLVEKKSRPIEIGAAGGRGMLALIAILAALPNLSGTVFGVDVAWIAFAVATIATIPFNDLRTIFQSLRKQPDAELSIKIEDIHA